MGSTKKSPEKYSVDAAELEYCEVADISETDIVEAMKSIPGYLDITPRDFREVYKLAYNHALKRLRFSVKVEDVMTKNVIAARRKTPLREVALLMAQNHVVGLPALETDGKVAGMITESDFLKHMGTGKKATFMSIVAECVSSKGCPALTIRKHCAEDIMNSPAITLTADMSLSEVAHIFTKYKIDRAAVVNEHGHLSGFITRTDLVSAFSFRENQ